MNRGEKRHFSLNHKQTRGHKDYMKLYHHLEKHTNYNEEKIKKQLSKAFNPNQLPVIKNYLKYQLLESLTNYEKSKSARSKLHDRLKNIELLFSKELYVLCNSQIAVAQKEAVKYSLDTIHIEVLQWKRRLSQTVSPFNTNELKNILKEEKDVLDRIGTTYDKREENVMVYQQMASGFELKENRNFEPKAVDAEMSLEAQVYHHHSNYYLLLGRQEFKAAERSLLELLEKLEKNPDYIIEECSIYLSTANNLISFMVYSKEYSKVIVLIKRIRKVLNVLFDSNSSRIPFKQLARMYNSELEVYRDAQIPSQFSGRVKEIEKFVQLNEYKIQSSYRFLFWYQLASISFTNGQYNNALKWVNCLMNDSGKSQRLDIVTFSRILNLMIHYELKNVMVLGYYIDSTRRILRNNNIFDGWIKILLKYFSKLRKTPDFEHKIIFEEMRYDLFEKDSQYRVDENALDYIDLKKWIEIRCKTFARAKR